MRAAVIRRYGGPEQLGVEDRAEPSVGPIDVLTEVRAASLNPLDFNVHRTYPLTEVREAFAELERGHARGKIVVVP
jgi:NADPH:quinone reductase-like Zn-dependent oxidoreductase